MIKNAEQALKHSLTDSERRVPVAKRSVLVAIPTINRLHHLRLVIESVLQQIHEYSSARLLVVDNGSSDGTQEFLNRLSAQNPQVTWLAEDRRGSYYARSRAIDDAREAYIIFLDDDAVPQPGWLQGLVDILDSDDRIGVVGCGVDPDWSIRPPGWCTKRHLDTLAIIPREDERITNTRFPNFPPSIGLGIRLNECARLYSSESRRRNYCLGRKYGDKRISNAEQLIAAEDTDLCEIYARNGYGVLLATDLRVTHHIPETRLKWEWFQDKFCADGMSRIRLLRVLGYSIFSKYDRNILAAYPVFLFIHILTQFMPRTKTTATIEALYCKTKGAWLELIWGSRVPRYPFKLDSPSSQ